MNKEKYYWILTLIFMFSAFITAMIGISESFLSLYGLVFLIFLGLELYFSWKYAFEYRKNKEIDKSTDDVVREISKNE